LAPDRIENLLQVVAKDDTTLMVCNFVYDGKGPDAFFIVGTKTASNKPNAKEAKPGDRGLFRATRSQSYDRELQRHW
jgi:hypothetical protein